MPRGRGQKRKLLELARLLMARTDEENPISTEQIIEELDRLDISAERKSIYSDMDELRQCGLEAAIQKAAAAGTLVFGVCGGYQMMGRTISDPEEVEASGVTEIGCIEHIERGYEDLVEKLTGVGADIHIAYEREDEQKKNIG